MGVKGKEYARIGEDVCQEANNKVFVLLAYG